MYAKNEQNDKKNMDIRPIRILRSRNDMYNNLKIN